MNLKFNIPTYKEAPFLRIVIALALGIILQWYIQPPLTTLLIIVAFALSCVLIIIPLFKQKIILRSVVSSTLLILLIVMLGMFLVQVRLVANHSNHYSKLIKNDSTASTILVLDEPLVIKSKTYKANATILSIVQNDTVRSASGTIILYFKKDSVAATLKYGSTIITPKQLMPIANSGNPGAFNYQQFSLQKGITHQVFLNEGDYGILPETHTTALGGFLFSLRDNILATVSKFIKPEKERGLAEALLIGYRDDMDKDLSQAYSNTGTVHVIAISGLHLGFIYLLIIGLFNFFEKRINNPVFKKWSNIAKPIITIMVLWVFSLLAGAAPSILRSAIMFTCITIGSAVDRNTNIFNTLSVSAFIIFCINPFAIWDVGFQLSYAAVISIILFMKPIYNWFYFKNLALDWLWKLTAVTLSAQILTIPITIYHFHQFPNLFLITNIVAVPLSTAILAALLLLITVSWWPWLAAIVGNICFWLVKAMNSYIEWWDHFSFALSDYLTMNLLQCFLLYGVIIAACYWLLRKEKLYLKLSLISLTLLLCSNLYNSFYEAAKRKIVVYNISGYTAIDIVEGNRFQFIGDSSVTANPYLQNFHIKPARIHYQTDNRSAELSHNKDASYFYNNKHILIVNDSQVFTSSAQNKPIVDILVATDNATNSIENIFETFKVKQVVADASNKPRSITRWQAACTEFGIPFYSTNESGAYILDL